MTTGGVRRVLLGVVGGCLAAYLAIIAALYFTQRSMIYPVPQISASIPDGYRRVSLQTADGLTLTALFRSPSGDQRVIVFFHGNGDNWDGAALANRAIAEAGYGVLLCEYRGYSANPGTPGEAGFYADGRVALAWLAGRGIGPDRTVLAGNSIGSGPATQLAAEFQPAGLVLISGFTSLPDVVAGRLPWLPAQWLVRDKFENREKIARLKMPILLLHGTEDQLVPAAQAQALQAANPAARLVLVPGFGHELSYQPAAQALERDWLDRL